MVMTEERLRVLKMLQEGRISAEEATQLLEALETGRGPQAPRPPQPPEGTRGGAGRWLRVRVTDTDTGKLRVNVRLPLNVVEAGMKMGMRSAPVIQDMDPNVLMEMIRSGEIGQIVDVFDEQDGEHVEVFIE
jgi:hypothetical protein